MLDSRSSLGHASFRPQILRTITMDNADDTTQTTWTVQCWPKPKRKRTKKESDEDGFARRTNWTDPHVSRTLAWLMHDDRRGNPLRPPLPADVFQTVLASFLHFDAPMSDMIYVCGGRNQTIGPLPTAEMFDSWHGKWRQLKNMLTSRAGCAAAPLNDKRVIVVGGYDGNGIVKGLLRSTEIYDPHTGEWQLAGDLCRGRWGHGCAALGDYVFAVGGCSLLREAPMQEQFMETLCACEVYDVSTNRWMEIAPLNTCRAGSRLVAVANRYMVAVGGCDDVFGRAEMLNTCEVFDSETNRWEILDTRLSIPRTTAAVAAISDWHVLVIGGAPNLKSTEVISVRTPEKGDCAEDLTFQGPGSLGCHMGHLSQGRMGCQAVCVTLPEDCSSFPGTLKCEGYRGRRMVVVLGGEDGEEEAELPPNEWSHGKQFKTLEMFDIEARSWMQVRLPEMRTPRTAMAACASYGIVGGYR